MERLAQEITVEFIDSLKGAEENIGKITAQLEDKGKELSQSLAHIEELEGAGQTRDDVHILMKCPLLPVLREIKMMNAGSCPEEEEFPEYLRQIRDAYLRRFPGAAILHPLCIVHQHIRKAFLEESGVATEDIACRNAETGEVAISTAKSLRSRSVKTEKTIEDLTYTAHFSCVYRCSKKKKIRACADGALVKLLEKMPVWALGKGVIQNWR